MFDHFVRLALEGLKIEVDVLMNSPKAEYCIFAIDWSRDLPCLATPRRHAKGIAKSMIGCKMIIRLQEFLPF